MTIRKVLKKHYKVNDADYLLKLMPFVNISNPLVNKKWGYLNAAGRVLKPKTIDEMLDKIINDNDFI